MNGARKQGSAAAKAGTKPASTPQAPLDESEKECRLVESCVKSSANRTATQTDKILGALDEEELNCAPEEVLAEEERLRKEREEANKETLQDIFNSDSTGTLSAEQFHKLDQLIEHTNAFSTFLVEQMDAFEEGEEVQIGTKRKATAQTGRSSKHIKKQSPTAEFLPLMKAELRDYQLKGVKWLASLYSNGLNGILADQMGLGKTIQTIGFLSHLQGKHVYGPFMILGPLSTLANWVAEFERFCPALNTLLYHGNKKDRTEMHKTKLKLDKTGKAPKGFPVVITSFEIAMADIKILQKYSWKYIIVDEGHRLKNFNCKLLRELRTLQSANKLILSGTPLQNNLGELWSLLNFLLPDVFNNMAAFQSWFDFGEISQEGGSEAIAAQEQRNHVVSKLHALLKPFLLRRIKSDVENSLPPKKEIVLYASMTDKQKEFNDQLRDRTLNEALLKKQKEEGGRLPSSAKLNNMIMQLRKNCNHPDLISSAFSNEVYYPSSQELLEQCGKLQLLNRLLLRLKENGHKVLIFSQMTKMLDILDTFLEQEGHKSCRLDGSISWQDRQKAMKDFNTGADVFCFLLSTRAGGLGINLTAADTVIIYDSDWNPHQDMQAMDRAHRIGQSKPVLVLRLATGNSVEGRMLRRANSKLMLERLVIRKGAFLPGQAAAPGAATSLSKEELMELLKDSMPLKDEPQAGVASDKVLDKLLDRKHMLSGKPAPYKDAGVGYEVVVTAEGPGLLSSVQ